MAKALVTLFRDSGKYYTDEEWEIPTEVPNLSGGTRPVIGPYDMEHSPSFRRIGGGAVLVSDGPWGYPHLFPKQSGLTKAEEDAIKNLAETWDLIVQEIVGDGPSKASDLAELASLVHALQARIMAQSAARAHPDLYRLLGEALAR